MTQEIATLGIKVDSSQVRQASDDFADLRQQSAALEQRIGTLATNTERSGSRFEGFSQKARNAILTLGGIDGRARAALALFQEAPLRILGVAGAVATVAAAYVQGAREAETFARVIALSGNAAGTTAGELALMAQKLDGIRGTQAAATQALAAFVATGKVASEDLLRFTAIGQDIERNLGIPIEETAERFASLAEKPTEAAAKLQKSFNFLTPAIYDYIRAQERSGDVAGAASTAQTAYAAALEKQSKTFEASAPLIIRAWDGIKSAAAEAWDEMLGVGRQATPEGRLQTLLERRGEEDSRLSQFRGDRSSPRRDFEDAEIARLQKQVAENKRLAEVEAARKKLTDAYVESQQESAKAGEEFAASQQAINEAWRAFDLGQVDRGVSVLIAKYDAASDELDAMRSANLVRDEEYFARRRSLVSRSADAEIKALLSANQVLSRQDGLSSVERIAAQNKVAENTSRIAELRIRTASQLRVIEVEEQQSLRDTANAYTDAQVSADRYVDTLVRRFQVESQGLGLGDKERQRLRERSDLELRFEDRRQDLDQDRRRGDITQEKYEELLEIEQDALSRSQMAYDEHYKALEEKQGEWLVGVSEAIRNFADETANVAKSVENILSNAFYGAADALTQFAMTGKADFRGLVNSIISDLLRMQLQIVASKALSAVFGGFAGGFGSAAASISNTPGDAGFVGPVRARASGGPVSRGRPYLIGEQGPELMVPDQSGFVVPNHAMGGSVVIHNVNHFGAGANVAQISADLDRRDARIKAEVYKNLHDRTWKI